MLKIFDAVSLEIVQKQFSNAEIKVVHVRLTNVMPPDSIRSLRAEHLNRY